MENTEPRENQEGVAEFIESGNRAEAKIVDSRIKTPEQLIEYLGLDMDVWEVERAIVNKWEVGAKHKPTQTIMIEPLFQVKLWLIKRYPVPIEPVVSPIQIKIGNIGIPNSRRLTRNRALLLCDPHIGFSRDFQTGKLNPFHDRIAISAAMQIASQFSPETIILAGDLLDLAEWTDKFLRSPDMYYTTQPAIIEAAWIIGNLRKIAKNVIVMEGNHDQRIWKMLISHFSSAYELRPANKLANPPPMSVESLLGLEEMDVKYIGDYPNGKYYLSDNSMIVHGSIARSVAGATAAAHISDSQVSIGYGHIHRRELVSKTIWSRDGAKFIEAYCPGGLCKIDGSVPGCSEWVNWQQGIAMIEYDDEHTNVDLIPIEDGYAYYRDRHFVGEDYEYQLGKESEFFNSFS